MLALLRDGKDAAPLPRFWERLEPRLREEREVVPLLFWERWNLRAIPAFLAMVVRGRGGPRPHPADRRD